jgi:multiple sugar transport system permease protein
MNRKISILAAALLAFWALVPFYQMFNLAFEPYVDEHADPPYIYPVHLTFSNMIAAFKEVLATNTPAYEPSLHAAVIHSMVVATVVMLITMAMAIPAGYVFSRFSFPFRTSLFFLIIFAKALPSVALIIPYYTLYKMLNIVGTYQGVILAELTITVPLAVWVTSGVFASIPTELDKQARVDGASKLQAFQKILIPVAGPGLFAVTTIIWLTCWNEYVLSTYLGDLGSFWTIYGIGLGPSTIVIALIPSVVAIFILQRYMTTLRLLSPPMSTNKEPERVAGV